VRGRSARGNGTNFDKASNPAARHKSTADSRGETMVPAAAMLLIYHYVSVIILLWIVYTLTNTHKEA